MREPEATLNHEVHGFDLEGFVVTSFVRAAGQMPILYEGTYYGYIGDGLDFAIVSTHPIPGYERVS
jgi:hypothetical protein